MHFCLPRLHKQTRMKEEQRSTDKDGEWSVLWKDKVWSMLEDGGTFKWKLTGTN